jgi:hypothetical protein
MSPSAISRFEIPSSTSRYARLTGAPPGERGNAGGANTTLLERRIVHFKRHEVFMLQQTRRLLLVQRLPQLGLVDARAADVVSERAEKRFGAALLRLAEVPRDGSGATEEDGTGGLRRSRPRWRGTWAST